MKEEFKEIYIPGYLVSNTGKVVSTKSGTELAQSETEDGYLRVALRDSSDNQRQHGPLVHRLVAFAFIGEPDEGQEVDHIDQDKTNNVSTNLRWVTRYTQQRNTPNNVWVSYQGKQHILKDICAKFNKRTLYANVLSRVNRGKGSHQDVFDISIKGLTYVE